VTTIYIFESINIVGYTVASLRQSHFGNARLT